MDHAPDRRRFIDRAAGRTLDRRSQSAPQRWARRLPELPNSGVRTSGPFPFVSVHVPTHNEPPEMVLETLRSLLALDYQGFEVVVLDNNTDDEALWRPVEQFCKEQPQRLRFHHLADWTGYKSGALNFGLTVTDSRAELIAVVDADYLVDADWLLATAPMFADPQLAFVRSPQDYRGWQHSRYYRRLYHSYDYFFRVSQRSRDERDAAIFGGTMGLVRRSALEAVGGWDEWCITEDAELSLRLQKAGWSGRLVDASFGHGVMPLTFEALKGQRFRWCFGGIQILRLHHRSLMPWNRDPDNRLSQSQRLAYLVGALQWFGDLLGLAFFTFLLLAAANIAFDSTFVVRRLSPVLLVAVPTLTALAIVRAVAGVRRAGHGTWREAAGTLGIWLALTVTVARACVRGAVEPVGVFLRTPKTRGETSLRSSLRMNRIESVLGLAGTTAAALVVIGHHNTSALLVAATLGIAAAGYLAAPINSIAALRADLPDRLRRRRATERSRAWTRVTRHAPTRRAGLLVMILATAVGGVVALAPSIASNSTPGLGRQRNGPALLGGIDEHQAAKRAPSTPPPRRSTRARPTDLTSTAPVGNTGTTPALTPTPTTTRLRPSSAALLPSSAQHTPTSTPAGAPTSAAGATTPVARTSSARVTTPAPVPSSPARTTPARTTPTPAPTVRPSPSSTRRP